MQIPEIPSNKQLLNAFDADAILTPNSYQFEDAALATKKEQGYSAIQFDRKLRCPELTRK